MAFSAMLLSGSRRPSATKRVSADSDEVAHAFRFDVARDSDVKPPRDWDLAGW
jgi:hypothetical protein